MALGATYRFSIENKTGQTIAASGITVTAKRWKFDSTGQLSFEGSEATPYINSGDVADSTFDEGGTVDNTSNKWIGGDFLFTVTAPDSSSGDVVAYFERSTDAGTDWDSDGLGMPVAVLNFTASGIQAVSFSL